MIFYGRFSRRLGLCTFYLFLVRFLESRILLSLFIVCEVRLVLFWNVGLLLVVNLSIGEVFLARLIDRI